MNARTDQLLGLVYDLPNDVYHASAGISYSGLRNFSRSPAHYFGLHLDPRRPPQEAKGGQLEGTLAHCAILEPQEVKNRYAIGPTVNRNTKVWKEFVEANPTKVCIQLEQYQTAINQANSVRAIPDVARLFSAGMPEVSAYWIDNATGELCRCRPDWVHPVGDRGVILVDVKTYSDASPREFSRQVARKGYHGQAAWYSDGYQAASGLTVLGFVFVAVESEWPHASSAVMLDDEGMAKGRADNCALLQGYAECRAANNWPSYSPSIELITLPAWAL